MEHPPKSPSPTLRSMLSSIGDVSAMLAGSPTNSTSESTSVSNSGGLLPNGKKTKGRVKIKMEYIGNKLRRYTTFSKRKTGIMKKAYELSTLTGTQVMLLVASETGHVYTFATKKLTPMISSEAGKNLIQQCLAQPNDPDNNVAPNRSEFTFDMGTGNARKRRGPNTPTSAPTDTEASIASFLPTMVPTSLFQQYTDEDYQEDSDDVSDSEETAGDDSKSEEQLAAEEEKEKDISTTLQQTLKEALKAAANNRASIAAAKKRRLNGGSDASPMQQLQQSQQGQSQMQQQVIPSSLLAPFLMAAMASTQSSTIPTSSSTSTSTDEKPSVVYSGPQGVVYAPDNDDGGLNASQLLAGTKAEDTQRLLSGFPFNFNLQQLLETAALGAVKTE